MNFQLPPEGTGRDFSGLASLDSGMPRVLLVFNNLEPRKNLLKQGQWIFSHLEREPDELAAQAMGLEYRGDEGNGSRAFFQSAFWPSIPFHAIHQVPDGGQMVVHRCLDVLRFGFPQTARGQGGPVFTL